MKKYLLFLIVIAVTTCLNAQRRILPSEAGKHVGEKVTISGKIVRGKLVQGTKKFATVLDMGANTNNPGVSIIIEEDDRRNFPYKPEEYLNQKRVSVTGVIVDDNGRSLLSIDGPEDIKVEEPGGGLEFKPLEFDGFNRFFQD